MRFTPLILIGLAGCASRAPSGEMPAPPTMPAPAPASTAPKHMLFRATGPSGAAVFILGSVHLLSEDVATLPAQVDSAFGRAKTVAFETSLDTLQLRAMEFIGRATLPVGTTLKDVLSPKVYADLETLLPAYNLNVQQVSRFKPWMVGLLLTQVTAARAQFKAEHGVDFQLNQRAKTAGKRLHSLEPVDFQLGIFDNLTAADQEFMLSGSLITPDSALKSLMTIKDAWLAGDTATLNQGLTRHLAKSPAVFATFMTDRNRSWVPQIEEMLKGPDDALVVVGAAHLVGREGVIEMLQRKGYRVEQL